jgi:NTP pyrophosphatase (non-canonical NTP hydrolase)
MVRAKEQRMSEIETYQKREQIVHSLFVEIERAEKKHPGWTDDPFIGLSIIGEELGEANQAAIEAKFRSADPDHIREEVEHVACTALRFLFAWDEPTRKAVK